MNSASSSASGKSTSIPLIRFIGNEAELHLTVRQPLVVEMLQMINDPHHTQLMVETFLGSVATMAGNATTVNEFVNASKEIFARNEEMLKKQAELSTQAVEKSVLKMREDLVTLQKELIKQSIEDVVKNNAELRKALGDHSKELREEMEKKILGGLVTKFNELSEKVQSTAAAEAAAAAMAEKTTAGGLTFQEEVGTILQGIVAPTTDIVERVAETPGRITRCKVGDFVVNSTLPHHALQVRIVVETTKENMSRAIDVRAVQDEMRKALENREADTCLYLFRDRASMPAGLPPVKFGANFVIACAENTSIPALLELAKALAGMNKRIEAAKNAERSFDFRPATTALETLERTIADVDESRRLLGLAEANVKKAMALGDKTKTALITATDAISDLLEQEA